MGLLEEWERQVGTISAGVTLSGARSASCRGIMRFEVRTSYDFAHFPGMDDAINEAVGRPCDFAACDFVNRDLGWVCEHELDAARIVRALRLLRLRAERRIRL